MPKVYNSKTGKMQEIHPELYKDKVYLQSRGYIDKVEPNEPVAKEVIEYKDEPTVGNIDTTATEPVEVKSVAKSKTK